jgi:hypothetical protein
VRSWIAGATVCGAAAVSSASAQPQPNRPAVTVRPTADFEVTGTGADEAWRAAEWVPIPRRQPKGLPYDARFKVLYSATGIYFLMDGTDRIVTATMTDDFMDLWNEDVFEVFLWTDERHPVYFEYEISPLGKELPILVPNFGGDFLGWRPWHYEKDRLIRKATSVSGGPKQSGAAIEGWRAEFFIPYALLKPLQNVPPKPGTRWRANVYRVDHDEGRRTSWVWSPVRTNFHDYENFGVLVFGER